MKIYLKKPENSKKEEIQARKPEHKESSTSRKKKKNKMYI